MFFFRRLFWKRLYMLEQKGQLLLSTIYTVTILMFSSLSTCMKPDIQLKLFALYCRLYSYLPQTQKCWLNQKVDWRKIQDPTPFLCPPHEWLVTGVLKIPVHEEEVAMNYSYFQFLSVSVYIKIHQSYYLVVPKLTKLSSSNWVIHPELASHKS